MTKFVPRLRAVGKLVGLLPVLGLCACSALHKPSASPLGQERSAVFGEQTGIGMTAWAVPAGARSVHLQVRLAPREFIDKAVLAVRATGLRISPSRFVLHDLQPSTPRPSRRSPPNLPALGMTVMRTFHLVAPAGGSYRVVVELRTNGRRLSRELHINIH